MEGIFSASFFQSTVLCQLTTCSSERQTAPTGWRWEIHRRSGIQRSGTPGREQSSVDTRSLRPHGHQPQPLKLEDNGLGIGQKQQKGIITNIYIYTCTMETYMPLQSMPGTQGSSCWGSLLELNSPTFLYTPAMAFNYLRIWRPAGFNMTLYWESAIWL